MKRYSYFLICGILLAPSLAFGAGAAADAASAKGSIHQLSSSWKTQEGETIRLSGLSKRVSVMTMGYTSCDYTCPILIEKLRSVERSLSPEERQYVQFVFVSLDPERDTPARMKAFMEKRGLDPARWLFISGSEEDTLELAVLLAVRYKRQDNGVIAHSNLFVALDPNGEIVETVAGTDGKGEELLGAVRRAVAARKNGKATGEQVRP